MPWLDSDVEVFGESVSVLGTDVEVVPNGGKIPPFYRLPSVLVLKWLLVTDGEASFIAVFCVTRRDGQLRAAEYFGHLRYLGFPVFLIVLYNALTTQ